MSKEADRGEKSLPFYIVDLRLSSVNKPSVSFLQTEKSLGDSDGHGDEAPCSKSVSTKETVCNLHVKDDFPDGGLRAWLVVLGCSCSAFATFGHVNAFGVFQAYYQDDLLKGTSPSSIAWIGSTQYATVFLPALVTGRLLDIGYLHTPMIIASIILVVCTFLIAECHTYWHFLLCQGFGVGVSSGFIFGPVMPVIAHWFKRRRSTALGVVAFASSVGGTVFPVIFQSLKGAVGFKWAMRVIAFILTFMLVVTNLTLKRRLPPVSVSGGLFNLKQFKSPAYSVFTAAAFVAFLGLYTVLIFIDASAPSQGVPPHLTSYLVAIANAGSAIGRLSSGILADRIGPLNVMVPAALLAGLLTFLWPHLNGAGALIPLAIIYGASSGAFAGLIGAPLIPLGDAADVGRRIGMAITVFSFGALAGPPISGAVAHATGSYSAVGIYAGSASMVAVVLLVISRFLMLGRWRGTV